MIFNGDAEAGPGAGKWEVVPVPGWQTTGSFSVWAYRTLNPTGSAQPGNNFFAGGPFAPLSTASQVIDVSAAAAEIDQNAVTYQLDGELGGYKGQSDYAELTATFKSASAVVLGSARIEPVTPADRGGRTALVRRSASGLLPAGTRSIEIVLRMVRTSYHHNDGYADNLSLILTSAAVAPTPPPKAAPEAPKPARLKITTQPGGAQAYLDDAFKGSTSQADGVLVVEGLPPGNYRLRVSRAGCQDWTQSVTLESGATLQVEARLSPAGPRPLSRSEIEDMLKKGVPANRIVALVQQYGVDFALTDEAQADLRGAGADESVLLVIARSKK